MRGTILGLGLLSLGAMATPAQADPYQWCAVYGGDFGGGSANCYFVTLSQCQATLSGLGGLCRRNPYYTGSEQRSGERSSNRRR